jgi:hypothetical protein
MKNKPTPPSDSLLEKLIQADICCRECGQKYGVYSVGVSSTWIAECPICGETKGCTETRDYGYLSKGISEVKAEIAAIKELKNQKPIMTDEELEEELTAPYEIGEITLKLTEDEVGFLNECLDTIVENHPSICAGHNADNPEDVALFESIEKKITALYGDYCVKYELSPAMKAYYEKYNSFGTGEDSERWEIFRDAYNMGAGRGNE